jgi:hypothetical protein
VAVAAGYLHSLGLKSNGAIVAWGLNNHGQGQYSATVPNGDYVAIACGETHNLGLKSSGMIVVWGSNDHGQRFIPEPNADFSGVAGGCYHSLGLKSDGSIAAWRSNANGQCDVPEPNADFTTVSAGCLHNLGLKSDGTLVAWGDNSQGQCDIPEPNAGFVAISAGAFHSLALRPDVTGVEGNDPPAPYALYANVPNPFNPTTQIAFHLPEASGVDLEILDLSGRPVRRLIAARHFQPGTHSVLWDGKSDSGRLMPSGVYFYRLRAGEYVATKSMTLIK